MESALKLTDVVKKYPDFTLGPLNLELTPGTTLGYIGSNGAGKTTTMHCITNLVKYNEGTIEIFGRKNDLRTVDWKFDIGYVGDINPFYENWTAEKNLKLISKFYPKWSNEKVTELAKRFDLPLYKTVKALSSGNRVKLALVSALARSPRLLLLDEPTAGLDPVVREEVLDVFFEVIEKGENAIFYSTHIISDINKIADELAFLKNGQLILRKTKDELVDSWRKISFKLQKEGEFEAIVNKRRDGNEYCVISKDFSKTIEHLRKTGAENIQENRMSLEEITIEILKGECNG